MGQHIISIASNDELPYWDGLNANGKEMNAGVYFYRITYQVNIYSLPEMKEITGYFHLNKINPPLWIVFICFIFLIQFVGFSQNCSITVIEESRCLSPFAYIRIQGEGTGTLNFNIVNDIDGSTTGLGPNAPLPFDPTIFNAEFNQSGTYTITMSDANGCQDTYQIPVFDLPIADINLNDEYYMCNGSVEVNLQVIGDFESCDLSPQSPFCIKWNDVDFNDAVALETGPILTKTIYTPGEYNFSLQLADQNGCSSTTPFDFIVNDGPSDDNVEVNILNGQNCVDLGSDYLIGLDVISDFTVNNIVADTLILTTDNPTILFEDFTIPTIIQFSDCPYIDLE